MWPLSSILTSFNKPSVCLAAHRIIDGTVAENVVPHPVEAVRGSSAKTVTKKLF